jgi:hypothetical protein
VFATIAAGASLVPAGAFAATAFERPPLSVDRFDVALSDGEWDELQEALRQTRTHSPAAFSGGPPLEIDNNFAGGGEKCGRGVATGDFNGDGLQDVAMGCPYNDDGAGDAGSVIVLQRNASNTGFLAGVELDNNFPGAADWCGQDVEMYDVNGDGRDDIVMGCQMNDDGQSNTGSLIVFTRNAANSGFNAGVELDNNFAAVTDYCGLSVAGGDVNGDGLGDVAMGCWGNDDGAGDAGSMIVFTRNSTNTGFDAGVELDNNFANANDVCGTAIALGDVNGDGRDDALMGCPINYLGSGPGSMILFTRNATNTGFDAGVEITSNFPAVADYCGMSVAIGDLNGDGRGDIAMGCMDNDDGAADAGSVLTFTRNVANNGFDAGVELDNNFAAATDECGESIAIGDVNGDGRADVAMGCAGNNDGAADAGSMIVFARNVANSGFVAGVEYDNHFPGGTDECGRSIALGDLDSDGRDDLAMGCWQNDDGSGDAGSVILFFDADPASELVHPTPAASDTCGTSTATGDVNGDGLADIVIGCDNDDTGGADAGSVVVFIRNATNSGFNTGIELNHPTAAAGDTCGWRVALGDVNGDGYADITMGCRADQIGAFGNAGSAVVFTRNGTNTGFDAGIVLAHPTPASLDHCGRSVAVGDLNGDGRADVAMGCQWDDTGGADAGSVVAFTRNAANTGFDPGIELGHPVPTANDACGRSVAVGDVNADGRVDIALGCVTDDTGGSAAGSVVVITRNAANTGFDAGTELNHPTPTAGDECGQSVAMGDVNADGRADIAMGCYLDDTGATSAGSVVVLTRNAANTGFDAGVELGHPVATLSDECGWSVSVGDVNGDGRADVAIGCHQDDTGAADAGSVVVRTRNAANSGFDAGVEVGGLAPVATDMCGESVATGDINADGRSDLVIGCYLDDTGAANAGSAVVALSTSTGVAGSVGTSSRAVELGHPTPAADDQCGMSATVGDFNGDGRADVATGCIGDDTAAADAGRVVVRLRDASNTGYEVGIELAHPTPAAGDSCGQSIASGDVNGDGRDDIAVGCNGDDTGGSNAGSVVVLTRNTANSGFDVGVELGHPTPAVDDACGWSVGLGDFNGDGRDDIAMGCFGDDTGGSNAGRVVVRMRNAANTGFDAGIELGHPAPFADDQCGLSVAAGDVNGDGRDDIAMGCSGDDTGGSYAGSIIVRTRDAGNAGFDPGVELGHHTPASDDWCGWSMAAGDVNGDGRDDLVMGCPRDDTGGIEAGSAVVRVRNSANTGFDAGVELGHPSPAGNDLCGWSLAVADVNGDRFDDVVAGCPGDDSDAGSGVVFARNAAGSGFDTGLELEHPTPAASDTCSASVAAGDLNADARADVALGCTGDDTAGSDTGSILAFTDRSTIVQSRRLNLRNGVVTNVTVNLARVANGAAAPTVQASANGGTNWENVTVGASHAFVTTGTDLRLRVRLPEAPTPRMTQTIHDLTIDYTYLGPNVAPDVPVLVSPAAAASTADTTPDLVATFSDPDGADTGTIDFELCTAAFTPGQTCAAAGGTPRGSGSSPAGIANGANGTWTVTPALVPQVVYWRARATDNGALQSAWSAARTLTIAETITIGVDSAALNLGPVLTGSDATGTTVVDVQSNDPQGYTLTATDESDTWGADCVCGDTIVDWTGTGAAPSVWAPLTSGADGFFGVTVRDTTGQSDNRLAKWGTANAAGWPAADFTNNRYAGLDNGASIVLHDTTAAAPADTITVTSRTTPSATSQAGVYTATVTLTVTGKP